MNSRFSRLEADLSSTTGDTQADGASAHSAPGELTRDATFHFARAEHAMHEGQHEQALQFFTRSLREDRSRLAAWVGQLQMLMELREDLEARLWAEKSLDVFKGNGELLACRAQASARIGDAAGAIAQSDLSIKAPGSSPLRWIARGETLLAGRPQLAAECFAKALAEENADWYVLVRIARVHLRHDRPGPAAEHARNATAAAPERAFAWETLGACNERLGLGARAAECYGTALQLAPARRELRERITRAEGAGNRPLSWLWRKLRR
ncbi:MAG: hypothetical protein ACOYN0_15330 [Phycisphaerales bacterium]